MMLMMIVGTIIVVVVIFLLIIAFYHGELGRGGTGLESPLEIAKRRYAAGEIDREAFERIRRDLEGVDQ